MGCHMIHFNFVPFLSTFEYQQGVPFCQGWLSRFCWMRAAFIFCCPRRALNFVSCVGTGASALSHPLPLRRAWQLSPSSVNGFSGPGLPCVPGTGLSPSPPHSLTLPGEPLHAGGLSSDSCKAASVFCSYHADLPCALEKSRAQSPGLPPSPSQAEPSTVGAASPGTGVFGIFSCFIEV